MYYGIYMTFQKKKQYSITMGTLWYFLVCSCLCKTPLFISEFAIYKDNKYIINKEWYI